MSWTKLAITVGMCILHEFYPDTFPLPNVEQPSVSLHQIFSRNDDQNEQKIYQEWLNDQCGHNIKISIQHLHLTPQI